MTKLVVLLNGPSSSGKSTLAAALKALLRAERGARFAVASIDDVLRIPPDQPLYEDDVFAVSADLNARVLSALAGADGAIVDHVVTSERVYRRFLDALPARDACALFTVRVTCPLPELRAREARRGDRHPGSAEASERWLYPADGYDIVVDTSQSTPAACAARIASALPLLPVSNGGNTCGTMHRACPSFKPSD